MLKSLTSFAIKSLPTAGEKRRTMKTLRQCGPIQTQRIQRRS